MGCHFLLQEIFLTLHDGQGGKTGEGPREQTEKSGRVHQEPSSGTLGPGHTPMLRHTAVLPCLRQERYPAPQESYSARGVLLEARLARLRLGWAGLGWGEGRVGVRGAEVWALSHPPAACSFPGENARSWGALGEARPGQSGAEAVRLQTHLPYSYILLLSWRER